MTRLEGEALLKLCFKNALRREADKSKKRSLWNRFERAIISEAALLLQDFSQSFSVLIKHESISMIFLYEHNSWLGFDVLKIFRYESDKFNAVIVTDKESKKQEWSE